MISRVTVLQVAESVAPHRNAVAGPRSACQVRSSFDQRHLESVSSAWVDSLFGNFSGQNGPGKTSADDGQVILRLRHSSFSFVLQIQVRRNSIRFTPSGQVVEFRETERGDEFTIAFETLKY